MLAAPKAPPAAFGTVLGIAPGNVPVYSCDYDSADNAALPDRHAYRNYIDGIFMGYKWQCVEIARRWLYVNRGYIFDDIAMAYDIFRLRSVRVLKDNSRLPLHSFANGAGRQPEPGCLLIWDEGGEFEITGHVAVVTEVFPDRIRFVEQNVEEQVWPEGQTYSRELKAKLTDTGEYWIECGYKDASILGWVVQTDDATHAEEIEFADPKLFNLQMREVADEGQAQHSWLNVANDDEAAYVEMISGHMLSSVAADQHRYFCLSETAQLELKRATNELHALFMHATDFVLQDDALLQKFNIPPALWPKIHQSWDNRRNQMITGRFDFAVSDRGIKVYEYNCDSASCHMECGKVQGKWAAHFDCDDGEDAGDSLFEALTDAWQESGVDDVLHIMQDRDLEETYHALFMKEALEQAGISCKVIHGVAGLSWGDNEDILDADGVAIKWVWKTWAWETALDQIRAECEDDAEKLASYTPGQVHAAPPRLVDVLLRPQVMVFEPLWTLIPSNKAILPILWQLFPDHPFLLNSAYELNEPLRKNGYVSKPIVGRCGSNISIYDHNEELLKETRGQFEHQDQIYQELCKLPNIGGYNVQVSTFSANGSYAGAAVRVDPSLVVTSQSDLLALRVIEDDELTSP